jgi:hypothetical protein
LFSLFSESPNRLYLPTLFFLCALFGKFYAQSALLKKIPCPFSILDKTLPLGQMKLSTGMHDHWIIKLRKTSEFQPVVEHYIY